MSGAGSCLMLTLLLGLCLTGCLFLAPAPSEPNTAGPVRRVGPDVWLKGLERWPSWMTHPGGYVACERFLGLGHSPAWVYGGSGFAFALNVHSALCPSGPTAWRDERCSRLAANVGLDIEGIFAGKDSPDFADKQRVGFEAVCKALDAGHLAIGWEMDIPEFYVVCGYDGDGNYLYRGLGNELARVHHSRLGDTGIGVHYVMIVRPGEAADDRQTIREAAVFALEVAAGGHGHGGEYSTGVAGYDAWIRALGDDDLFAHDETAGFGLAYNASCWAECRRMAASFLEEARRRLADPDLDAHLGRAADSYRTVAQELGRVAELFPFKVGDEPAMAEQARDASRRAEAADALRVAREAESEGLRALAAIAAALGAGQSDLRSLTDAPD